MAVVMKKAADPQCAEVHRQLEAYGALLLQDKLLPSIVGIFAGPLSTSWWTHPRAQAIFDCLDGIQEKEAVTVRLFRRKVTFVHRRLYPALLTVGSAMDEWQMRGLSPAGRGLLGEVTGRGKAEATGKASRELQERLLVAAHQEHGGEGHHETVLEAWKTWGARLGVKRLRGVEGARAEFESIARAFETSPTALPWFAKRSK